MQKFYFKTAPKSSFLGIWPETVSANGKLKANSGWTDKFIFPPYEFKICNALLTNFHMPESTLLMMACAFGGYDLIMKAYQEAIKKKYRFLTYGDTMLII